METFSHCFLKLPIRWSFCFFLLCQVLRNIVSNAIKFSPQGGKVTIRAFFDKTPVVVSETKDIETGDWPQAKSNGKTRANVGRSFLGNARSSYKVFATSSNESSQTIQASQHKRLKDSHRSDDDFSIDAFAETDRKMSILSVGSMGLTDDAASLAASAAAAAASLSENGNNGNLIIMVSDSGPGISEANQKKLFRSVIQFDPEKNQGGGGSGFGLFISKGIVDLHNGSISVRSEGEGHGCSFILAMPMALALVDLEAEAGQLQTADENDAVMPFGDFAVEAQRRNSVIGWVEGVLTGHTIAKHGSFIAINRVVADSAVPLIGHADDAPPLSSRETPRKRYRLLIVDDSRLSRKMLCKAMRAAGHECEEAGDGLVALNKVKEKLVGSGMYNAILMDRNMPVMDGPSAAKAMRDLGVTIPIFGVTGDGEDNDIDYFKSHGATAVLVKPMDMNEFLRYMVQYGRTSQKSHFST